MCDCNGGVESEPKVWPESITPTCIYIFVTSHKSPHCKRPMDYCHPKSSGGGMDEFVSLSIYTESYQSDLIRAFKIWLSKLEKVSKWKPQPFANRDTNHRKWFHSR